MSAPSTIDSLAFARSSACISGEVAVAALGRLVDMLAADEGTVRYRLCGRIEAGRPALCLEIATAVRLVCQRCLEPYTESLNIDSHLPIARDEGELARWERDEPLLDGLVAEADLDVLALVEDEILLGLPVAPRHPDGGCATEAGART